MVQPDVLLQDKNCSFFLNTTFSLKLQLIVGGALPNLLVYCHFPVFVDNASQKIREMAGSFWSTDFFLKWTC